MTTQKKSSARETLSRMRAAATGSKTEAGVTSIPANTASSAAVEQPTRERRKTMRYTIDLATNERRALRAFAFDHDTDASVVIRAFIGLLRDQSIVERVLDEIRVAQS